MCVQVYSQESGQGGADGGGGNNAKSKCSDDVEGVTPFVALLATVYYLPLLVFISVSVCWLLALVW